MGKIWQQSVGCLYDVPPQYGRFGEQITAISWKNLGATDRDVLSMECLSPKSERMMEWPA